MILRCDWNPSGTLGLSVTRCCSFRSLWSSLMMKLLHWSLFLLAFNSSSAPHVGSWCLPASREPQTRVHSFRVTIVTWTLSYQNVLVLDVTYLPGLLAFRRVHLETKYQPKGKIFHGVGSRGILGAEGPLEEALTLSQLQWPFLLPPSALVCFSHGRDNCPVSPQTALFGFTSSQYHLTLGWGPTLGNWACAQTPFSFFLSGQLRQDSFFKKNFCGVFAGELLIKDTGTLHKGFFFS